MINIIVIEDDKDRAFEIKDICDEFNKMKLGLLYPQVITGYFTSDCIYSRNNKYCFNITLFNDSLNIKNELGKTTNLLGVVPEKDSWKDFPEEMQKYYADTCAIRLFIPENIGTNSKPITARHIARNFRNHSAKCHIFPFEHEGKPNSWVIAALGYKQYDIINPKGYKPVTIKIVKYNGQVL